MIENPANPTTNYVVIISYLVVTMSIGLVFAGRQKGTKEFFLAGRSVPWLIVAMSMFATLVSAVTYIGMPGLVYSENISIYAGILMMPLVAPVIIVLFFPFYKRLGVTTSYEYIRQRFGHSAGYCVSALFVMARLGWLGTVIYAPALALSVVTGMDLGQSILLMGLVATAYTALGGLAAVIWTDALQFLVLVSGAFIVAVVLIQSVPGGISEIITVASASGRLDIWNKDFSITEMTITAVALSYFLNFTHDFGVDQISVQRLLATPSLRDMARATVMNAVFSVVIVGILAFIGLGLYTYYSIEPDLLPAGLAGDRVFPHFVVTALPAGISGLILAGVFAAAMSSLDSGINSLSTVVVNDFVRTNRNIQDDKSDLRIARALIVVFGTLATAAAFVASSVGNILQSAQVFLGLFSGPVLALFVIGVLTRRGSFAAWVIGTSVAIPVPVVLDYTMDLHFIYYFPLTFGVSLAIAWPASFWLPSRDADHNRTLTVWN